VQPSTATREEEAIAALRRGEGYGLEALITLHQGRALRLAYTITGSRAAAEDIVAEYFEDMDDRGIADLLGWPVGTVKTRLHRARGNLRVRLTELHKLWACGPAGGS